MGEIKSTIVGLVLMSLGVFFIYSDRINLNESKYIVYGCFGLIALGVYLIMTKSENRAKHMQMIIKKIKGKRCNEG